MSFLNTIKGFGRSSRKGKKDLDGGAASPLYSHPNNSGSPIRRSQSPTKISPSKQQKINEQIRLSNNDHSPTRKTVRQTQQRSQPQQAQQQTQQQHQDQQQQQQQQLKQQSQNHSQQKDTSQARMQPAASEVPLFLCEPFVKTALVKGSFKTIVQLPKYVDYGEWIALNIFEIFNNLNSFYAVLSPIVTPEKYPTMNAGPHTNYLWIDASGQAVNLPACHYIDYVLTWISKKINDQSVFPTKNGGAFPPTFLKDCKNISRQMFRIFAHVYHNHFETIVHLSLEAHWNSFFAHFISFTKEHNLIDRGELEPLLPLIINFEQQGKII
ncbi:uncharacterized protein PRCAT00003776001 [Priceomyces carsonii]|uniref:uncharacterized protein n=1 Tax=Priceomyces carsonii TaxID=28549 RepID=UPI002ED93CF2|nr:unnamed protein product [Priceomyces carsonii]